MEDDYIKTEFEVWLDSNSTKHALSLDRTNIWVAPFTRYFDPVEVNFGNVERWETNLIWKNLTIIPQVMEK